MRIFEIDIFGMTFGPSWYGLMYVAGFAYGYWFFVYHKFLSEKQMDTFLLWIFLGVVLGGRFGYVIFYNLPYYLEHPGEIMQIWKGGMAFHGGVIGVLLAMW